MGLNRLGVSLLTIWMIAGFSVSGCSTVTVPVLRHETGETLGSGKFKVGGRFESSRLFPFLPPGVVQQGVEQRTEIYQSSMVGFGASAGILPRADVQIGGFLSARGGGWRLGAKYQAWKKGAFAGAVTAGYGAFSSSGRVTYETGGLTTDFEQVLSVKSFDLAAPVSYRVSPGFAVYSGLIYIRSNFTGTVASSSIAEGSNDLGINLGMKININRYEGDFEIAFLRLYDTFSDSMRFVPYIGISGGLNF